jgi:iron(III) transport system substrate-binding protein
VATRNRRLAVAALGVIALGCQRDRCDVNVYTSVDQVFAQPVFQTYEKNTGQRVCAVFDTEETKSTGVLNRLIAEAAHPHADVFWSGDPVRPFLLHDRGLLVAYVSPSAAGVPAAFKATDGMWTGLAARARVLLVNTSLVPGDERPRSIRDLADPRWRGSTAIANPLFGTTTTHVAALASVWGEAEVQAFLESLRRNEVRIASSNGEVRRLVAAGEVAFGLTDTDDAHEATEAGEPVAIVVPDQEDGGLGAFVMPTAVVTIRGGPHPGAAQALVDFLLRPETEQALVRDGAHMPLRLGIETPPGVLDASAIRAMRVDYAQIAALLPKLEPWLRRWVGL